MQEFLLRSLCVEQHSNGLTYAYLKDIINSMVNDIIRDLNPNFPIPEGLKGFVEGERDSDIDVPVQDADIDIQFETLDEEDSVMPEPISENDVEAPDDIQIISQTVRTAPDGRQVVDVVIDVAEVRGAVKYDVRITKTS